MKNLKILHFGVHNSVNGNLGDTVHFFLLRRWFEQFFYPTKLTWKLKQIWERNSLADINEINKKIDLVLIGGGGLFLSDQKNADTSKSGWQLNMSTKLMAKIEKPIVVFGVGYNRFRNQKDFNKKFKPSINTLYNKSIFFGLRNTGSIRKTSNYLGRKKKLILQPCITTIMNKLKYIKNKSNRNTIKKKIAIGFAADRINYRFRNKKILRKFISTIENLILIWKKNNYKVEIILHKNLDILLTKKLDNKILNDIKVVNLTDASIEKTIDYYKSLDLLFAMRGHHQLIAAGLCTPFYSIISHDKIKFFVKDNNLSQYSADVNDTNFKKKILNFSKSGDNIFKIKKKLGTMLKNNLKITLKNSRNIKKTLFKSL